MQKITPCMWFETQAEEAAEFYVSVFENSEILHVSRYGEGGPMPAGTALAADFVIDGVQMQALNGMQAVGFTEAISLSVSTETQEETDRLWDALTSDGGEESMCGWLKDKYGVSWQIVPTVMHLLGDPDQEKAGRAMQAMMRMKKIIIADIQAAFDGA
ncbi:VOC family protein [Mycetocola manganoxydans]|uniref:VOC family protein n=1 Tax=Mycetocola manganoxydans TaxID=699879 RepID=A0A3L6ZQL3_9MICO|nr:VOC family protein [Mycetocola manganoxydans]RLP70244.1 VOC family protein [Mycetocola manganoxydans]GHD49496.1 VOC family protein [Mycetocola manganoxydans]